MTHILPITKSQKALVSYILIGVYLINKTKFYLYIKTYIPNKKNIKKYFLFGNQLVFIFYLYCLTKKYLVSSKDYLILNYLVQFFNLIEFLISNFVWHFINSFAVNFGYIFYIFCINPFLHIFRYLFPSVHVLINNSIFYIINQLQVNISYYLFELQRLISSLSGQILIFLFNSRNLINIIFYIIKGTILFFEIGIILSMIIIIEPIRNIFMDMINNGTKNWNFTKFSLIINNYFINWINAFYKQKTILKKIRFIVVNFLAWICLIICVINHSRYLYDKIRDAING